MRLGVRHRTWKRGANLIALGMPAHGFFRGTQQAARLAN